MNVKFKMPKFIGKLANGEVAKELLLTVLGTSISIILTFGTSSWIEKRQREKNRMQTAMMVINDIYLFKYELQMYYDKYFIPWKNTIEELRTMPRDSILRFTDEERERYWDALAAPMSMTRDKTAENIFSSDISTWRDVGNYRFIRIVGHAYSSIAEMEKNIQKKMDERGNNTKNFQTNYATANMTGGEQLITYMEMNDVRRCADDFCKGFCPYVEDGIKELDEAVKLCMEVMNISVDDMNDFLKKNQ